MTMELLTALLPQANTIAVFNKNVLKDSVSGDLWTDILR
jgi:hypothetical protein